jgi:pimeloyl-ACP methyl ester carboxylesterase
MQRRFGVENARVRFDIVAHSMGGLLTRYFLRYGGADLPEDGSLPQLTWAGAEHVDRVILVAPPNGGSLEILLNLVEGRSFNPVLPTYSPAILGTFPSTYQLLPRSRHRAVVWDTPGQEPVGDLFDSRLWQQAGWGLADTDQDGVLQWLLPEQATPAERRQVALDHLQKSLTRARGFAAALDRPATPPENLHLYLVAGDAVPTDRVVAVHPTTGKLRIIDQGPGDGSVLRTSALMDERVGGTWTPTLQSPVNWESTLMLFTNHLGLTRDPIFVDNVLYWLLEDPRLQH